MKRTSRWTLPALIFIGVPLMGAGAEQAAAQALPDGVTAAMVETGKGLFNGAANCASCHGPNGAGTPVGPTLTDQTWLHVDGSYPQLKELISTGVPQPKESMIPMLPKGGSTITDAQVAAVAAYVWSLSHGS